MANSDVAAAAHGELLLELSFLVNERKSVDEVFASFARRLLDVADFDYTTLLIGEPGSGYLEVLASYPFELSGAKSGQVVPTSSFKFDVLLASPEGYEYVPRAESATPASREMAGAGMCRAWVSALTAEEHVFGVFTVARKAPEPFGDDERAFMLAACRLLTAAVRQEMELRRARRAAARAEAANELALALNSGESIEQSFQRLTSLMHTSIAADYVGLFLDRGEGFMLVDEEPRGVHQGIPATDDGTRYILERLGATDFTQARPQKGASPSDALVDAGYRRLGVAVLRENDRPAGLVILGRKHSLPFNEDEQAFIELLRSLLSQSLTNSWRLARSEADAARSHTLNEVALLLNRGETVDAIFSRLLGLLANAIELDYVGLLETAGNRNTFRMIGSKPELMRPAGTIVAFEETAARAMLDTPEPVVQYQLEQSIELLDYNRRMYEEGMRRGVSVVIRQAGEVVGLLALARKRPERYGPEEVAFIETLTAMLGQAIANHRKLRASQAEAIRAQVLSELSMLLQEGDAFTARFDRISELLLQAVGFDHISVTVRQPGSKTNLVVRSHELTLNGVPLEVDPAEGIALLTKDSRLSQQYRTARSVRKVPRALHEGGFKRAASTVILSNDGVEGVVTVGRRDDIRFDERELGFIELVAALIGQAIANQRQAWTKAQEAEEQAIIAEAASAVAREITALSIAAALRQAVGRFIPQPFCNFGYLEGESVIFSAPGRDRILLPIGPGFRNALDHGYDLVPRTVLGDGTEQARAEVARTGLQSHVVASAQSGGETVGLLIVGSRDPDFEPGDREVRLARLIADIVGPAMANVRAIERQRQEGEDQRLLAEVAAAAAREGQPAALLAALHRPIRAIVPSPTVIFGYRDGDQTIFPRLDGTYTAVPLDLYLRKLDDMAQIHSDELPGDLFPESELWQMGLHAISTTAVLAAGVTVGYLMVASRAEGYRFSERELRLFRLIAQIVGPAMENARAAEKAREDAEEQSILAEAAAALAAGATEQEIAASLTPSIKRFLPECFSTVFFVDGEALISPEGLEVNRFGPAATRAMQEGQVVVERPWPELSEAGREMLDKGGFARFVNTSLNAGGVSTGILFVGVFEETAKFRERDLRLIRLIAGMAGPALANARESGLRRQDAEEQRFLAETAAAAASAASEAELVRGMAKPFEALIPGSKIDLFFYQDDEMLSAITGLRFPVGAGFREALETGQSMGASMAPGTTEPSLRRQKALGITYAASTRLSSGGQTLGLFWLGTTRDEPLSERDLRICRLVADVAGPALANLRESRRRQEDAEDQRFLAAVAASVARATTQEALVRGLWEPFRSITPASRVAFFFREGDILRGPGGEYGIGPQVEEAFREGMSLGSIEDPKVLPRVAEYMRAQGVTAWAHLLAESEGETLGILHVALVTEGAEFSPRELRLYRLAAAFVGPAMAHLRENARRAREAEDERVLARVAAMAAVTNSTDELIQRFTEILADFMPTPLAFYGHAMGDQIRYRISLPNAREQLGLEDLVVPMLGASKEAREQGQGTGNLAVRLDQPYAPLKMQAYAVTAYHSAGSEMGLLLVATRDPDFEFSIEDLSLLRRIAQVLGPAIEAARAETERARQADLYSLMLRSLSEGVILADNTGRPVFSNDLGRKVLRALNPAGDEIEWHNIIELLPEEAREPYRRVFELGEAGRGRTALLMEGQLTHIDFELVPLDDPQMKLLVVVTDVTADVLHEEEQLRSRERMEQAARLAALGELISGVAHELNNPLTAVVGFAELMSANPAAESLSEEISVIRKEARRAADIVRDLLFIARPGTSERSLISVNELIGHIERIRRAHWADAEIAAAIAIDAGCHVWGNEHQLTQVILNLITNAEHALAGRPERQLRISASCGGGRTTITVSDSGNGMDQATIERIWEPFFTTRPGVGTGLGLPLSYSIIQSHNGVVTVDSKPGVGTTIRLDLPAEPDAPGATPHEPIRDITTARVLVVDDEPSLRKVCQRLVASLGHECDTAENSIAAIELARTKDYDLVLCDYRLATETAERVITGFAEVAPSLIERTVIATGATTDAGVLELTERHHLQLMAKPYGVEELSRIIDEALSRPQAGPKAKTPFPALPGPPVS